MQRSRNVDTELIGGFDIDYQFKRRRLHHWQVGSLVALENTTGVYARLTIRICDSGSVADEPSRGSVIPKRIDRRDLQRRRSRHDVVAPVKQKGVSTDE